MYSRRRKISLVYASKDDISFKKNRLLHLMLAIFAVVFVFLSCNPVDMYVWWFENILPLAAVLILAVMYKKKRLCNSSYACIFILLIMHIVGAHYTYSLCPAGIWLKDYLKLGRNNYDRMMSFAFGVLAYFPVIEILHDRLRIKYFQACILSLSFILSISAVNEIIQIYYPVVLNQEQSKMLIGMQGDIYDSQKDMGMVFSGSFIAMTGFILSRCVRNKRIHIVKKQ
ncbi:putative membrane protein [Ruminiclostridium sufflavum DSM 19573]|uniref:Putative membrane protein n=1 Tax=Ruminiclostridium sufflavum DSM 19573 TaxID=1121337 RepID=A0A318Y759_9FIRM|nr:DUF2238 domain-containing protein [Ruminiclostridium sufflavum]PYG87971.1 putative membrane protein [Ruminiclostridium sufflavum DSM 19573]